MGEESCLDSYEDYGDEFGGEEKVDGGALSGVGAIVSRR
jgi:hypothetical protein